MAASKGIRASGAKTFEPGFNIISVPMRPANTPVISMSRSFSFKKGPPLLSSEVGMSPVTRVLHLNSET